MDVQNVKDDPGVRNLVGPNEKRFYDVDKASEREELM